MMLYTGKGDTGTTILFDCPQRVSKDAPRIHALGNLDELNSWIGYCAAVSETAPHIPASLLRGFQEELFIIQAIVAGAPKELPAQRIRDMESLIARVESEIDPIRSFTIPGATVLAGALDVGRTIARRAERGIIALADESLDPNVIPYVNRLSSALFALARLAAHREGIKEQRPSY